MAAAVYRLLIVALLLGGVGMESQQSDTRPGQVRAEPIALTSSSPEASFIVRADTLASSPTVLALNFTRVVNPARTSLQIFVYLSYRTGEKPSAAPVRILLGNTSLYPADRPGGFRLRVSDAFGKLKAANATDARLVIEMERIHPAEPWSQVEVTVAPPQWRSKDANIG